MTELEPWTIGRLLEWTKDYLGRHGAETPRLDAEVLLAHARRCRRIELYTAFDEVASDELRASFRQLVKRRSEGTPVAYLVGYREFYSLAFRVTPDVLIPRPETEFLVIRLLDLARQHFPEQPLDVVDVGTGSGVVGICAALHLPAQSRIVAIDLSEQALAVAGQNAQQHGVHERIELVQSDLFASLPADRQFDIVVSNPPYVSQAEFDRLDTQVREHEPQLALLGGPTGTEMIDRLIAQATSYLKPNGWLLMEISPMISDRVQEVLRDSGTFARIRVTDDLAKLPRIVEALRTAAPPYEPAARP